MILMLVYCGKLASVTVSQHLSFGFPKSFISPFIFRPNLKPRYYKYACRKDKLQILSLSTFLAFFKSSHEHRIQNIWTCPIRFDWQNLAEDQLTLSMALYVIRLFIFLTFSSRFHLNVGHYFRAICHWPSPSVTYQTNPANDEI